MRQLSLFCGLICALVLSNQAVAQGGLGNIGLNVTAGEIVDEGGNTNTDDLNDVSTGHLSVSYDIEFTDFFAIGAGYIYGDSSELTVFADLFTNSRLEYKSFFISAKVFIPFTERDRLYLDVNRHDYDYDVIDDDVVQASEEGKDYGYSIGWYHKFRNQVGLKVGYDVTPLGDNLEIKGAKVGVTYSF